MSVKVMATEYVPVAVVVYEHVLHPSPDPGDVVEEIDFPVLSAVMFAVNATAPFE
jgi:hypothetical protein